MPNIAPRSYYDPYKCTECEGAVSAGDKFCKHCGHRFTVSDVEAMRKESHFPNWLTVLIVLGGFFVLVVSAYALLGG